MPRRSFAGTERMLGKELRVSDGRRNRFVNRMSVRGIVEDPRGHDEQSCLKAVELKVPERARLCEVTADFKLLRRKVVDCEKGVKTVDRCDHLVVDDLVGR